MIHTRTLLRNTVGTGPTRRLVIGLDAHGVLLDRNALKSEIAHEIHKVKIPPADFKRELILAKKLLTEKQYREVQLRIREDAPHRCPGTYPIILEVMKYLPRLIADGNQVFVITSNEGPELEIIQRWVKHNDLTVAVIGTGYGNSKIDAIEKHGLDVYVDDDLCKIFVAQKTVPHRFLFTQDHNKDINPCDIARRVDSWKELYSEIKKLPGAP